MVNRKNLPSGPPSLSAKDLAQLFSVRRETIYRHTKSGFIPAFKVGRRWRYNPVIIRKWFAEETEKSLQERIGAQKRNKKQSKSLSHKT